MDFAVFRCCFIDVYRFLLVVGFPVECVCVALPAALQNPPKKHVPGALEHLPGVLY